MDTNDRLIKQIETLRNHMTEIAFTKGFTSDESIEVSQKLDNLLNQYDRMNIESGVKNS
ncbi:Spo0E family sporulation regulatory protein-aspartic acid phosphatase [Virgibacillus sp. W0181]|uniref:Spo0E family sporulation regulatory protein-aspartic acid phosphatase n=1 Tax=Virgibacillus sp. W0181 TaxID=3391581 RepID=UPI003F44A447